MNFFDESGNINKKCPTCGADFLSIGNIAFDRANCSFSCPAKKLEMEHEEIAENMIAYCLPKEKVILLSPKHIPVVDKDLWWGETDDIRKAISIPWYTLRSKKEFLDTVAHEIGHITAYKKIFNLLEREAIYTFDNLKLKLEIFPSIINAIELASHHIEHKGIISRYLNWGDGHDGKNWYLEYLKFHKKLINSSFKKYAYGNIKPRDHGFNERGEGSYKPKRIKIS